MTRSLWVDGLRHEVDDDPGLLARMRAHDAADALLVDALRRRRREMHADRRARRVPALGEQHRVDEDVDLAPLVGRERLGETDGGRATRDRLGFHPSGPELLGEVVGVVDAGGVDDAGGRVEKMAVEARGGLVQGLVVEGRGQCALLEVAADDRHRVDGGRGRHAQAAERGDQPAAGRVAQRQVVDRGGEDVGDLLRDQLLRRGHADVDRLREAADGRARLLAERRMGLVADDELVRVARDRADVAGEPGVGLDRDRVGAQRLCTALDHGRELVAVSLRREVARELGDEQAAVGQDQHAERPGRLDEPGRRDRLAGGSRMAEAVAAEGAGILPGELELVLVLVVGALGDVARLELLFFLELLGLELGLGDVAVAVLVLDHVTLCRGDQLREHAGERVDLVLAELGSRGCRRWLRREHPLEPEHEPEAHLPARRGQTSTRCHLGERLLERDRAGRPGRQDLAGVLVGVEEGLACPFLCSECVGRQALGCVRRECRVQCRF